MSTKNKTVGEPFKLELLFVLSDHIGKDRGIHAMALASKLQMIPRTSEAPNGLHWSQRKIRTVIQELRNDGQHICGHPSTGYYMAENSDELKETTDFLYRRAMASLTQVSAMTRESIPDLVGQQRFTDL